VGWASLKNPGFLKPAKKKGQNDQQQTLKYLATRSLFCNTAAVNAAVCRSSNNHVVLLWMKP